MVAYKQLVKSADKSSIRDSVIVKLSPERLPHRSPASVGLLAALFE
jgi:hypothetical protein